MRFSAAILLCLSLGACYGPDWIDGQFKCQDSTDCPSGLSCVDGLCRKGGGGGEADMAVPEADMSAPGEDLRMSMSTDDLRMGQDDMRMVNMTDMRPPADMAPPPCTVSGQAIGASGDVYACRGGFMSGGYGALCGSAYHTCALGTSGDVSKLRTAGMGNSCPAGFYAVLGDLAIRQNGGDRELRCSNFNDQDRRVIVGCAGPMPETGIQGLNNVNLGCGVLNSPGVSLISDYYMCGNGGSPWSCVSNLGNAAHTFTDRGGVLCCRN